MLLFMSMVVPATGNKKSSRRCCAAGVVASHTLHALKGPTTGTAGIGFPLTTAMTELFCVPE